MAKFIAGFTLVILLLVAEYFLCIKFKSPLLGGIIPALVLGGTIYIFAGGVAPFSWHNLYPFIAINVVFFGDWASGREKYKKLTDENK